MIKSTSEIKYKRILLKLSGEALMGKMPFGIDPEVLEQTVLTVCSLMNMGVQVGIVIGGGNLFRGKALTAVGLGRVTGDHMGMLATVMNALAFRDALSRKGVDVRLMSALPISGVVEAFEQRLAIDSLNSGEAVIFAGGTGNPFFTTDSAACLRAIEIDADIVLKATKVDGIYSADPAKNPDAKRYDYLTYHEVITQGLEVMDLTAICLCQDHGMPIQVFNMNDEQALAKIVLGERVGTIVGAKHDQ